MSAPQLRVAARIILAVGAVATIAGLAYASGGFSRLLDRLTLWALLPYALFLAASAFAGTRDRARALLIVCVPTTLVALFIYGAALLLSTSLTKALIVKLVPLYQVFAAVLLLAVLFFTRRAAASKLGAA